MSQVSFDELELQQPDVDRVGYSCPGSYLVVT